MTKPNITNWSSFTKRELIHTIKTLNKRQTVLLNEIAALRTALDVKGAFAASIKAGSTVDRLPTDEQLREYE